MPKNVKTKGKRKPTPHTKAAAKKKAAQARAAREEKEQFPKQSFLKRLIFGEDKPDLSELEAGSTTILDILSPSAVDTKSRDYIVSVARTIQKRSTKRMMRRGGHDNRRRLYHYQESTGRMQKELSVAG